MTKPKDLFQKNYVWAEKKKKDDPEFFAKSSKKQTPKYLWIGCSDSRVPATQILGLQPGELFVHRNIANLFPQDDLNCLAVLQYAVEDLSVEHIIVCGHYGCGGVAAAMENIELKLVDSWLQDVRDVYEKEKVELDRILDPKSRNRRLVEFNTLYQVMHVCQTRIVQKTWAQKKTLAVHGWVYDLASGLLRDLNCSVCSPDEVDKMSRSLLRQSFKPQPTL